MNQNYENVAQKFRDYVLTIKITTVTLLEYLDFESNASMISKRLINSEFEIICEAASDFRGDIDIS